MISVGFKTDKGALRSGNEDSLFVMPAQQIYIVADGVGGHNSGELASRMAVGYIAQYVAMHPISEVTSKIELRRYFLDCFQGANELIYHKSLEEEGNNGMATTTVLCYLDAGDCYIVNVGAVGYPRFERETTYVIYDSAAGTVTYRHLQFDFADYARAMDEQGVEPPAWVKCAIISAS